MTKRVMSSCLWVGMSLTALVACKQPDRTKETEAAASASAAAAAAAAAASAEAEGSAIDKMTLPAEFPPMKIPEDNPQTDAKVALGHQLFFDKRLSVDGSRACYSCHMNENGTGGADPIAIGAQEKKLTRHSPMLWNVGYLSRFYWDGRADSLEAQTKGAWGGGNMGVGKENLDTKAKEIGKIAGYKKQFDEVFKGEGATADTVAKAVAAYMRTLVCNDTKYDKYAKGDKKALDDAQKKGLALFVGKAGCTACHTAPFFSSAYLLPEGTYFNVGTGLEGTPTEEVDIGRKAVTEKASDWAAFKPPSLRNVTKTAPYFHNGSKKTLDEAVHFMASGGYKNTNRSPLMVDRQLSEDEIKSLVSFLGALECGGKLEEPKLPE